MRRNKTDLEIVHKAKDIKDLYANMFGKALDDELLFEALDAVYKTQQIAFLENQLKDETPKTLNALRNVVENWTNRQKILKPATNGEKKRVTRRRRSRSNDN